MPQRRWRGRPTRHAGNAAFRYNHGGPAAQLSAAGKDADLLVVGSRGRNPLAGLLLGSVSRGCLHQAPCPVAVVRTWPQPTPPHSRVIVGIDGSDQARQALQVAAEEARLRDAAPHAIHAVHWDHLGAELVAPTTRQLVGWGRDLVAAELIRTDVAARPVILNGPPATSCRSPPRLPSGPPAPYRVASIPEASRTGQPCWPGPGRSPEVPAGCDIRLYPVHPVARSLDASPPTQRPGDGRRALIDGEGP